MFGGSQVGEPAPFPGITMGRGGDVGGGCWLLPRLHTWRRRRRRLMQLETPPCSPLELAAQTSSPPGALIALWEGEPLKHSSSFRTALSQCLQNFFFQQHFCSLIHHHGTFLAMAHVSPLCLRRSLGY